MKPIRAKEARELAQAIRPLVERPDWRSKPPGKVPYGQIPRVLGLRPSSTRVLELLLRSVDENHVVSRRTSWIAAQLDLGHRTVERARRELEEAGLVYLIRRGLGTSASIYRVAVERIRQIVGAVSGTALCRLGDGTPTVPGTAPSRPGDGTQRAGARDARVPALTSSPLTPQSTDAPEPVDAGGSPPAPPLPPRSKCEPHGRRSCRQCGLDRGSLAKVARERAKREESRRVQERAEERRREEAAHEPQKASEWLALSRAVFRGQMPAEHVPEHVNGSRT